MRKTIRAVTMQQGKLLDILKKNALKSPSGKGASALTTDRGRQPERIALVQPINTRDRAKTHRHATTVKRDVLRRAHKFSLL
jgi:hypothetical protein